MEIPVYFIAGFLESGKTTFINNTLFQSDFCERKERTVLIRLEDGEEEYDEKALLEKNVQLLSVDSEEAFTLDYLKEVQSKYKPQRVMIEFNGTWSIKRFVDNGMPRGWVMAQMITLVDSQTFNSFFSNMRQFMTEQLQFSELVIFNRCDKDTKKTPLRKAVKLVNKSAQVVYDFIDDSEGSDAEEELPYDINADIIDLSDDDYGIFYLDASDSPMKYNGKKIRFTAMIYRDRTVPKDCFIPGRMAMTCCANDMAFIGFLCKGPKASYFKTKDWAIITAEIKVEYYEEYEGEGPVLYLLNIEGTTKPEEEVVYMY